MIKFTEHDCAYQIDFPEGLSFIEPCPACGKTAFTNGSYVKSRAHCYTCGKNYFRDPVTSKWCDEVGNQVVPNYPEIVKKIYQQLISRRLKLIFSKLPDEQFAFIAPQEYEHHVVVNQDLGWDETIVSIAHEVGHAIDWHQNGLISTKQIKDSIKNCLQKVTTHTLAIEQQAWLNAIDFLILVGYDDWAVFFDLYCFAIKTYANSIQVDTYREQLEMIKHIASKCLDEVRPRPVPETSAFT